MKISELLIWPEDERSTRNCFNAKCNGTRVSCEKDYKLASNKYSVSLKLVESSANLLDICFECGDFDNNWK